MSTSIHTRCTPILAASLALALAGASACSPFGDSEARPKDRGGDAQAASATTTTTTGTGHASATAPAHASTDIPIVRAAAAPVPADWNVCEDLDPRPAGHSCPVGTCGSNTPTVNSFPVDGLHAGACRNADGQRLVDGSLEAGLGRCPAGNMTLDLDPSGWLVGREPSTGRVVCEGAALVGAVFTVEATRDRDRAGVPGDELDPPHRTQILISQIGAVADEQRQFPAYVLSPAGDPSASLCGRADAALWIDQWLAPTAAAAAESRPQPPLVSRLDDIAVVSDAERARYAIAIGGDVFDRTAAPFERNDKQHWFNLACAEDALAKMRIRGLDDSTTPVAERTATLRMLTAKYRGGVVSHTTAGVTVEWKRVQWSLTRRLFGWMPSPQDARIEARWGENGATCLSHARLWRSNTVIPATALGEHCLDAACDEDAFLSKVRDATTLQPCGPGVPTEREYWTTYVVGHVPH